jgi:hypothetical protein
MRCPSSILKSAGKCGEFYRQDAKCRQENAEKTKREREPNLRILSISLPPLCELGVLAVKFLDFED